MYNRDSGDRSPPIPSGLEQVSKELYTLQWIHTSLGLTQRFPPSLRRQTLVGVLTKLLEDTKLQPYDELLMKLEASSQLVQSYRVKLDNLNTQIQESKDEYPEIVELMKTYPELTDTDGNLRYHLILKESWKRWVAFTMITFIIATFLLAKVFYFR